MAVNFINGHYSSGKPSFPGKINSLCKVVSIFFYIKKTINMYLWSLWTPSHMWETNHHGLPYISVKRGRCPGCTTAAVVPCSLCVNYKRF